MKETASSLRTCKNFMHILLIYYCNSELFYLQINGKRAKAGLAVVVQRRAAFCNGDGRGQPDSNVFSDVARDALHYTDLCCF